MKRTDLVAGQTYLHSTHNDWDTPSYGQGSPQEVLILSADGWDRRSERRGYAANAPLNPTTEVTVDGKTYAVPHIRHTGPGSADGVLVIGVGEPAARWGWRRVSTREPEVVATRYLRAPYAEGIATVKAFTDARDRQRSALAQRMRDESARAQAQQARLESLLGDATRTRIKTDDRLVALDPADMDALLSLADVGARAIAADTDEAGGARTRVQEFLRQWAMQRDVPTEVHGIYADPEGSPASLTVADLIALSR